MKKILIIDDDSYICDLLVNFLKQKGFDVTGTYSGRKGLSLIEEKSYELILCDYRLPDTDGSEILQQVKRKKPHIPVIIMTAYAEIKTAVKLIKQGAFDYVTKPIQPEEILQLVTRAMESSPVAETSSSFGDGFITGTSNTIKGVLEHVRAVAPTELTVLIEGETGSGKEYIARAIHYQSRRKMKPFIAVDCGAIPRELANSELFGHIKGAFTGAINDKKGYFEQAKGGTLFLDEVGNLPYENQVKLLRALQERVISRVGDNKSIQVDVRLIAASNDPLMGLVQAHDFREDLFHRLNEFKIDLPPLRERKEDILEFAQFFIRKANADFNKNITGLSESVNELFLDYEWFGNIRELRNVINRAVLLSKTDKIQPEVLPETIRYHELAGHRNTKGQPGPGGARNLKEATTITEKEVIAEALIKSNYNKSKAAQMLKIDRKTLYNKIKLYNIELNR